MDHTSKVIVGGIIGLLVGSVIFNVVSDHKKERELALRMEQEKDERTYREQKLDTCMRHAYDTYSTDWDYQCGDKGPDCKLTQMYATLLTDTLRDNKDRCAVLYK